jgi:transaldolase
VNVTLLFSRCQYVEASSAYLRGIERRIAAGLNPSVGSVASLFVSRWDVAIADVAPAWLHNQLGIAVAWQTYDRYRQLNDSPRWQSICNAGARPQRLLWASTGTKDPQVSDLLYVHALAAPSTINTMPEATLLALADHGQIDGCVPALAHSCDAVLAEFTKVGIHVDPLAARLLDEGATSFTKSWMDLMACIAAKSEVLSHA